MLILRGTAKHEPMFQAMKKIQFLWLESASPRRGYLYLIGFIPLVRRHSNFKYLDIDLNTNETLALGMKWRLIFNCINNVVGIFLGTDVISSIKMTPSFLRQ